MGSSLIVFFYQNIERGCLRGWEISKLNYKFIFHERFEIFERIDGLSFEFELRVHYELGSIEHKSLIFLLI